MRKINEIPDYPKTSVKYAIINFGNSAYHILDGIATNEEIKNLIKIRQKKLARNYTKRFCLYHHRNRRQVGRFRNYNIDIKWIKQFRE